MIESETYIYVYTKSASYTIRNVFVCFVLLSTLTPNNRMKPEQIFVQYL